MFKPKKRCHYCSRRLTKLTDTTYKCTNENCIAYGMTQDADGNFILTDTEQESDS